MTSSKLRPSSSFLLTRKIIAHLWQTTRIVKGFYDLLFFYCKVIFFLENLHETSKKFVSLPSDLGRPGPKGQVFKRESGVNPEQCPLLLPLLCKTHKCHWMIFHQNPPTRGGLFERSPGRRVFRGKSGDLPISVSNCLSGVREIFINILIPFYL